MAPQNREERRQMRQRGAASRTVNAVDFGISFGNTARRSRTRTRTPTPSVRAGSKTPASTKGRKTPATATAARGRRNRSVSGSLQRSDLQRTPALREVDAGEVGNRTGKRKIEDHVGVGEGKGKRRKTAYLGSVDEGEVGLDHEEQSKADGAVDLGTEKENIEPAAIMADEGQIQEEQRAPQKSARKPKKRKSIGQRRKKRRSSGETSNDSVLPETTSETSHTSAQADIARTEAPETAESPEATTVRSEETDNRQKPPAENDGDEWEDDGTNEETIEYPDAHEHDEPVASSTQKRRRKKRRSIGQQRKKRRSLEVQSSTSAPSNREGSTPQLAQNHGEAERAESFLAPSSPATAPIIAARAEDSDESEWEPPEEEEDYTELLENEETLRGNPTLVDGPVSADTSSGPRKPKRGQKEFRRPQKSKSQRPHGAASTKPSSKRGNKDSYGIPILVHRHTNLSALPTIAEESSRNAPADAEESPQGNHTDPLHDSFTTRQNPNAVDVLAQICRETIETVIEDLPSTYSSVQNLSNATIRHQRAGIESFGEKLEDRLFQMSQLLDQKTNLERRAKASKRQRAEVQARWFAIKKRREEVALEIDKVRRQNWQMEAEVEERRALGWAAGRVEGSLDRGVEDEGGGLEFKVKEALDQPCTKDDTLNQKAFKSLDMEIFIQNVPERTTENVFSDFLEPILKRLSIIDFHCQKQKGKGKKFAFLTLLNRQDGERFLSYYGPIVNSHGRSHIPPGHQKLVFQGIPLRCSVSKKPPDPFALRSLAKEAKDRRRENESTSRPGNTSSNEQPNNFNVSRVSCGTWEYLRQELVFVEHLYWDLHGSLRFGAKFAVIDLDGGLRMDMLYGSVHAITSEPSLITIGVREPPRFFKSSQVDAYADLQPVDGMMAALTVVSAQSQRRSRVSGFNPLHERISGGCLVYRIQLSNTTITKQQNALRQIRGIPAPVRRRSLLENPKETYDIYMNRLGEVFSLQYINLPFAVKFQAQRLAQNTFLCPRTVLALLPEIEDVYNRSGLHICAATIRKASLQIPYRGPEIDSELFELSGLKALLREVEKRLEDTDFSTDNWDETENTSPIHRVLVTPTGTYLSGPEPVSKNRVLRKYPENCDDFIRVEFHDEDGAQVLYHPDVSNDNVFDKRFRGVLDNGLNICAKGMIALDSRLQGDQLLLRDSMVKFPGSNSTDIEICDGSYKPLPLYLNQPLIKILEDMGVGDEFFFHHQNKAVTRLRSATQDSVKASKFLKAKSVVTPIHISWFFKHIHELGLSFRQDKFLCDVLEVAILAELRALKYKARIPVEEGYTLFGIMDETGTLKEGQIFCIVEKDGKPLVIVQNKVLITRSPSMHPGDVQTADAVSVPADSPLMDLRNCVCFSQKGSRDLPSMLSGGDLDGDLYQIILDPGARPQHVFPPAEYASPEPINLGRPIKTEDMTNFFVTFMATDQLGRIATQHKVLADQSDAGTKDSTCLKLAEMHSTAVDYSKSGVPIDVKKIPKSSHCRPDFMAPGPQVIIEGKRPISYDSKPSSTAKLEDDMPSFRYYESDKILGKLFRAIDEQDIFRGLQAYSQVHLADLKRNIIDHASGRQNGQLLTALWKHAQTSCQGFQWTHHLDRARGIREEYEECLLTIAAEYSTNPAYPLTELEVFTGSILGKNGGQTKQQRELSISMKERFTSDLNYIVGCMTKEVEEEEEALERSLACFQVGMEERSKGSRRRRWGTGGRTGRYEDEEELVSFVYVAAAICMREVERFVGVPVGVNGKEEERHRRGLREIYGTGKK
ncbi:MAG: hypothetical protein Q9227_008997 [Pyrenula ochraceoflavens]